MPLDYLKLQQLQTKAKLTEQDMIFLKEHLPNPMFESFLLEKATQKRQADQTGGGILDDNQRGKTFLEHYLNASEPPDLDAESNGISGLKADLDKLYTSPVSMFDSGRIEHHDHWKTRNRQDIVFEDDGQLCTRLLIRNTRR